MIKFKCPLKDKPCETAECAWWIHLSPSSRKCAIVFLAEGMISMSGQKETDEENKAPQ